MNIWKNRGWCPMLLKQTGKPFDSNEHIFEVKFDGIRAVLFVSPKELVIQSRNKKNITHLFPELQSIKSLVIKNVIFDGEIIIFDNGKDSFSKIQERLHLKSKSKILASSLENPVVFIAFDILYESKDLTTLKLVKRKSYLSKYKDTDCFIKSKFIERDGIKLYKSVNKMKLEGIVAKLKDGMYHINKRTEYFIKIKCIQRDEFIIGGYEKKKNDMLSLAIGEYTEGIFHFVGKVSIGKKQPIYKEIINLKTTKNYFCDFDEDINYVKPSLTCYVEYLERTKNNHLRHPIYKGISR